MDRNEVMIIYVNKSEFRSLPGFYVNLFLGEEGVIQDGLILNFARKKNYLSVLRYEFGIGPFDSLAILKKFCLEYVVDYKLMVAHLSSNELYNEVVESQQDFSSIVKIIKDRSEKIVNEELVHKKGLFSRFIK